MQLILIRHAETEGNASQLIEGWTNSQLTHHGEEQASRLGEALANHEFAAVYASTLGRVQQTLKPLLDLRPDLTPIMKEELRERKYGVFEGTVYGSVKKFCQETEQSYFDFRPEGGETFSEARERALHVLEEIAEKKIKGTLLIVAHGGIIQLLTLHLLSIPQEAFDEYATENVHGNIIEITPRGNRLVAKNVGPRYFLREAGKEQSSLS